MLPEAELYVRGDTDVNVAPVWFVCYFLKDVWGDGVESNEIYIFLFWIVYFKQVLQKCNKFKIAIAGASSTFLLLRLQL